MSASTFITAAPAPTITDPAFVGWVTVTNDFYSNTPVYSEGLCALGSTFSTSSTLATCCAIATACPIFTSCIGGTVLVAPGATSTCTALSTCKTDYIYQKTVDASPTQALYCETGADATWFRVMPTPGVDYTNVANTSTSTSTSSPSGSIIPWGGVGGGIGGFLITCVIIFCILRICGCCGGGRRGGSSWPSNNSRGESNWDREQTQDRIREQQERSEADRRAQWAAADAARARA